MREMFSSLSNPNYRIWFVGVTISNIGQWIARTAQSWLVLVVLTNNSAQALGYQTALNFLPGLLLTPIVGTVADRFSKRLILTITQIWLMIDAILLSVLVITGYAELWMVYVITTLDGLAAAFDGPARQAFVSEIVPIEQLPNAISLNSASFNTARLIGPGVSGLLIAWIGTGPVIGVNVVSFATLLACLALLNKDLLHPAVRDRKEKVSFRAGLRYVNKRPDLKLLLFIGFVVGGLAFNFQISNAVMATEAFGKQSGEYGALGSLMGVGALVAALMSARRTQPRLRYVFAGMVGYTVFGIIAAASGSFWLFAILQVPIGFSTITVLVTCNTMLQTSSSQTMRGRVMALWVLVFAGVTPLVSPLVGWLGEHLGPRSTVLFGVIVVTLALVILAFYMAFHENIRIHIDRKSRGWLTISRLEPAPDPRGTGTISMDLRGELTDKNSEPVADSKGNGQQETVD